MKILKKNWEFEEILEESGRISNDFQNISKDTEKNKKNC